MTDRERVDAALAEVERDYDISVLAARDLGSHAWNLDDPGSDRDPVVVFTQSPAEYATLEGYVASVDEAYGPVDLSGWNVRRFGEFLVESNPTALEFLHSPVVYRASAVVEALAADVGDQFEPIRLYHHYRSLAVENAVARPTVKRALYVLRAVLYARYIRGTHAFPALDFPAFLESEGERFDAALVERSRSLVARKRAGEGDETVEMDLPGIVADLPADIDPEEHAVRGIQTERVDDFIRAALATGGPSGEPS